MPVPHKQGSKLPTHLSNARNALKLLLAAAVGSTAALTSTQEAAAQEGLALSRFEPAPAGDRMFGVPSPYAAGHLTPHLMLLADYAHNPLVLRREADDEVVGAVIENQLTLHLNAALALWRRLTIDVDVPIALVQTGDDPSAAGQAFTSPSGADLGDLRLGARVTLFGQYHDPFQVALGAYFWLPTGSRESYLSDGKARAMPQVIVGGRVDSLVWSAAVGPEFRSSQEVAGRVLGTTLRAGAGAGLLLLDERLQVGPEVSTAVVLEDVAERVFNAEVLLGGRYRILRDLEAGLGLGPGLTGGVGTPDLRVVGVVAYTPAQRALQDRDRDSIPDEEDACRDAAGLPSDDPAKHGCPKPPDLDQDGVPDAEDACRTIAGVRSDDPRKNGCPDLDQDKDGIADAEDACRFVPGVRSDDPKKNGCPEDRDGDGIPDAQDACPDLAGAPDADPAKNGCPAEQDMDQDGIPDAKDSCPEEKGFPNADPAKNGCATVRVTDEEVEIIHQVQFDTDQATIKPISKALLDQVAQELKDHPEILSVEVQGHTDERGSEDHNKRLSQRRAEAVRQALIQRGVAGDRLTAKGYGREVPLDNNDTEEGRQKNRRVEFKIVQKKKTAK